jgi:hypothetical protein
MLFKEIIPVYSKNLNEFIYTNTVAGNYSHYLFSFKKLKLDMKVLLSASTSRKSMQKVTSTVCATVFISLKACG